MKIKILGLNAQIGILKLSDRKGNYMLSAKYRLTREKDFQNVFTVGRRARTNLLVIIAAANNLPQNRFGIVISSKISKKATVRNRLRRIIRQGISDYWAAERPGLDVVVIGQSPIVTASRPEVEAALQELGARLNIRRPTTGRTKQ